jgi:hypothetical protein
MSLYRLFMLALMMAMLVAQLGCLGDELFQGGVAIEADEAFAEAPGATVGVPGVSTYGLSALNTEIIGVTDAQGFDQHPTAAVNTTWTVWAYMSIVNVGCPDFTNSQFVGSTGALFQFICVM